MALEAWPPCVEAVAPAGDSLAWTKSFCVNEYVMWGPVLWGPLSQLAPAEDNFLAREPTKMITTCNCLCMHVSTLGVGQDMYCWHLLLTYLYYDHCPALRTTDY